MVNANILIREKIRNLKNLNLKDFTFNLQSKDKVIIFLQNYHSILKFVITENHLKFK